MNWKKIATSLGIQYAGRVAGLFISLLSVGLLTRYLGVGQFGEFTAAQAIGNLVITFSDFGFFWSTVQNFLKNDKKLDSVRDILGIRIVATLSLILVSLVIVMLGNFSPAVKEAYIILTLFIFASSVNNILIAVYQAEYKMVWPTVVDVIARSVNLGIIAIGVFTQKPFLWFVVAVSIAGFTNAVLNWIGLYRFHGAIRPKIFGVSWRKYYNSVALIGLMSLFSAIFYKIDVAILSWLKGAVDVGIYGAAQKVVELTMMMQGLFLASLFPLLVSRFKESQAAFNQVMQRAVVISAAIGIPLFVFGFFLTHEIINLIGGTTFVNVATIFYLDIPITTPIILTILLIFVMMSYLSSPYTIAVLASGEVKQLIKVNFLATLLNIGLNIWLIPRYSYLAAAVTTLFTEFLIISFNGLYFCYKYSFSPPWLDILKVVIATLPGVLFLALSENVWLFLRIPTVILLYGGMLTLLMHDFRMSIVGLLEKKAIQ